MELNLPLALCTALALAGFVAPASADDGVPHADRRTDQREARFEKLYGQRIELSDEIAPQLPGRAPKPRPCASPRPDFSTRFPDELAPRLPSRGRGMELSEELTPDLGRRPRARRPAPRRPDFTTDFPAELAPDVRALKRKAQRSR
jgi:hypothetical protein